ncbi:Nucleoid occlusion protein [subsurface metagenome]
MGKKQTEIYKSIEVDLIDPPEEIARLEIPEIAIRELAQSIKEQGLLQPIIVFKKGDRYEIVFGHRRWLATRYLKQKTISCKVVENRPEDNALARATENLQRSDLTPLEEAMTYQGLVEKYDMPLGQIGKITGMSAGVIKRRIDILRMPDSLIDAVHKRLISQSVAEELMRCPDEAHREYLIQMSRDHGVTVLVVRQWVDEKIQAMSRATASDKSGERSDSVYLGSPVYHACQICKQAKEIDQLQTLTICTGCLKKVSAMIEDGAFKT